MRDPERIPKILSKIESMWRENPDLRLCQMLYNLVGTEDLHYNEDLYYVEDDVIEKALGLGEG